ncbi:MAG: T9SS type A sorting domain-containing protein [Saprospiraceae bacterium]|nr:T9SS type A sorting domain-containing protein [Saprospiraceae bacterium]
MKNKTILFALFLMLGSASAFAQKTLSPSVQSYTVNWPYTLVKAMHRAGFDMPTMPAPVQHSGIQQRSALQLDSTKTFFGYDGAGDSTPVFRTDYKYPFADTKIEINYQFNNGVWEKLNRSTVISDDQQRLTEVLAEVFDPETQSYMPDSRLEIFPHGDSPELIDSFITHLWDSTVMDWHIIMASRNSFDAQDRLLENTTSIDYFGDPVIFRELYSYDANGDNHLIEEFGILGEEEFPTGRTELSYYDHMPIEVTVSVSDGVNFYPQTRSNYAYTLFGAIRKQMYFDWNVATEFFKLNKTVDYFYDNQQRLAGKETTVINQNAYDEKEYIVYAYVDDENLHLEWTLIWNDDLFDWVLDSKKFYYYSGSTSVDPDPVFAQSVQVWPNPFTGTVQLNLNAVADVKVFDAGGKLLQSQLLQPGQFLNLSALPAGVYTLAAQQGADVCHKKIVKQ